MEIEKEISRRFVMTFKKKGIEAEYNKWLVENYTSPMAHLKDLGLQEYREKVIGKK